MNEIVTTTEDDKLRLDDETLACLSRDEAKEVLHHTHNINTIDAARDELKVLRGQERLKISRIFGESRTQEFGAYCAKVWPDTSYEVLRQETQVARLCEDDPRPWEIFQSISKVRDWLRIESEEVREELLAKAQTGNVTVKEIREARNSEVPSDVAGDDSDAEVPSDVAGDDSDATPSYTQWLDSRENVIEDKPKKAPKNPNAAGGANTGKAKTYEELHPVDARFDEYREIRDPQSRYQHIMEDDWSLNRHGAVVSKAAYTMLGLPEPEVPGAMSTPLWTVEAMRDFVLDRTMEISDNKLIDKIVEFVNECYERVIDDVETGKMEIIK